MTIPTLVPEWLSQARVPAWQPSPNALNTTFNGEYILAGINTSNQPVNDYFSAGSANKAAVDTAFFAHFGFAQKRSCGLGR